ncbi:globoside alpha-1,3-N-acetylgalactosaminyltransferase 1-like isoform X2 [Sardina pilchardus]|uniref:globoside alpha-1,3-N-acetylgalactosaminyltransferase 1-like isoform X2 n=1 Tax=Sardina pilchardus TaxID=27697 RepID=UPI002E0E3154
MLHHLKHYQAILTVTIIVFGSLYLWIFKSEISEMIFHPENAHCSEAHMFQKITLDELIYPIGQSEVPQPQTLVQRRTDVLTVSPWLAPIVWQETFDPKVIDSIYQPLNITVATTVFAVGKYIQLLKQFLESAEKHYMLGYGVHYYVFTDQMDKVPQVALASGRSLTVLPVPSFSRWQEISLRRMEFIRKAIEDHIRHEAHFIFCTDVDMVFESRFGAEAFGELVATIHNGWYLTGRNELPYERRTASQAYVPKGQGDFYYGGALYGGHVDVVHRLTSTCEEQLSIDKQKSIEAAWQEESHLNRYFILHKPTKLLSPEYLWDKAKGPEKWLRVVRFATVLKNYKTLRPNV